MREWSTLKKYFGTVWRCSHGGDIHISTCYWRRMTTIIEMTPSTPTIPATQIAIEYGKSGNCFRKSFNSVRFWIVASSKEIKPMLIMTVPNARGPKRCSWPCPFSCRYSKNLYIVKPKLISEVAVLTQAIKVRSWARRVRSAARSLDVSVASDKIHSFAQVLFVVTQVKAFSRPSVSPGQRHSFLLRSSDHKHQRCAARPGWVANE